MLYVKNKSRTWRVPFTRWVLLRSPCEAPEAITATVSVMNKDGTEAYRVPTMVALQADADENLSVTCVIRLKDVLEEMYAAMALRAHSRG